MKSPLFENRCTTRQRNHSWENGLSEGRKFANKWLTGRLFGLNVELADCPAFGREGHDEHEGIEE